MRVDAPAQLQEIRFEIEITALGQELGKNSGNTFVNRGNVDPTRELRSAVIKHLDFGHAGTTVDQFLSHLLRWAAANTSSRFNL